MRDRPGFRWKLMLLKCHSRSKEVEVDGTDVDAQAITKARAGLYPAAGIEGLDPGLRERFLPERRDLVRVSKTLRECCLFAEHDLLRHPPFSRLDLVSCRNVLIYLDAGAQAQVLARFHLGLNLDLPEGLLDCSVVALSLPPLRDEVRTEARLALLSDAGEVRGHCTPLTIAGVVVDEDYRIQRFNALAGRIFGLLPTDLGQNLARVPATLDLPGLRGQVESVITGAPPLMQRVGQGERQYLLQIAPHLDAAGRRLGAILGFADISELVRAEMARDQAEERFRLFMDHSPAIAWIKDAEGRHVYLSRTCEQRFGVRLADWSGKTDAEVWPPETAEVFPRNDLEVLAADRPMEIEETTRAPDGRVRTWMNQKFCFTDAAGRRSIGGIGIDITERRRIEQDLLASGERYRVLAETMLQGVVHQAADGAIIAMNPAAERILGKTREQFLGSNSTRTDACGSWSPAGADLRRRRDLARLSRLRSGCDGHRRGTPGAGRTAARARSLGRAAHRRTRRERGAAAAHHGFQRRRDPGYRYRRSRDLQ